MCNQYVILKIKKDETGRLSGKGFLDYFKKLLIPFLNQDGAAKAVGGYRTAASGR
jgi:hypothetical protein